VTAGVLYTAEIPRRKAGNNIPSNQKPQANLEHFAASRHGYTRSKRIATIQTWIAIGFTVFAALILIRFISPEAKVLVTFFGISAAVVEVARLDPMQKEPPDEGRGRTGNVRLRRARIGMALWSGRSPTVHRNDKQSCL
jgi:hypothetical protein